MQSPEEPPESYAVDLRSAVENLALAKASGVSSIEATNYTLLAIVNLLTAMLKELRR